MQVFALIGSILYEGDELIGVYSSLEAARAARDAYRAQVDSAEAGEYVSEFDEYRIRAVRVDADAMSLPFFASL